MSGCSRHAVPQQCPSVGEVRSVPADDVRRGGTDSVGRSCSDGGHDRNDDMLLDGERSGVERNAKDLYPRYNARPKAQEGEGDQLSHDLEDVMCQ